MEDVRADTCAVDKRYAADERRKEKARRIVRERFYDPAILTLVHFENHLPNFITYHKPLSHS